MSWQQSYLVVGEKQPTRSYHKWIQHILLSPLCQEQCQALDPLRHDIQAHPLGFHQLSTCLGIWGQIPLILHWLFGWGSNVGFLMQKEASCAFLKKFPMFIFKLQPTQIFMSLISWKMAATTSKPQWVLVFCVIIPTFTHLPTPTLSTTRLTVPPTAFSVNQVLCPLACSHLWCSRCFGCLTELGSLLCFLQDLEMFIMNEDMCGRPRQPVHSVKQGHCAHVSLEQPDLRQLQTCQPRS